MSRKLLTLAAALGTAVALTACGTSPAAHTASGAASSKTADVKLMVGGLNKIIYLPAMLTQRLGFFAKHGLQVELLSEKAGVDAETAMLAGQVDGVVGFYDHTIDLQGKGKAAESVVQLAQVPGEAELVATAKADQIHSPADFAGRRLGVTGLGSSTNFLTKYMAVKAGVPVEKTTSVAVGAGDTFIAAITHGSIDAGMTTEPTISRLLKTGDARVLVDLRTADGTRAALGGRYPAACLYMTTAYVNSHKAVVQKLAAAFVETLRWLHSHSAEEIAAKMPADYYAGDKALYTTALAASLPMFTADGVMPSDGPQTVLGVLSAFDPSVKGHAIDLGATYTTEFVRQVQ